MGLESGTYIDSLVATNPTSGDPKSEGDNHIRLLKAAIKASFPGVTGAITATQDEINILDGATLSTTELNILDGVTVDAAALNQTTYLTGVAENVQTQINLKAPLASPALTGTPTAPTATTGTSTTQVATTAFVQANIISNATVSGENLFINSDFAVNQEEYTSGVITTGNYGHDMMKSISSASYTVSGGALTMVSGTLGQKNDELVAADGETLHVSVQSGSLTIGASGGAAATTITSSTPYSFTYNASAGDGFITITAATAAKGIRIGRGAGKYVKPEPRAEEKRCNYYYYVLNRDSTNTVYLPAFGNSTTTTHFSVINPGVKGISTSSVSYAAGQVWVDGDFNSISSLGTAEKDDNHLHFRVTTAAFASATQVRLVSFSEFIIDNRY